MLLEFRNIEKVFKVKKGILDSKSVLVRAVDGVNLNVNEGENLGLVGESGSGKTTLARMMLKLYKPDQGEMLFQGKNIFKMSGQVLKQYRKNCQMIFQDPYSSLDPRWNVKRIMLEGFTLDPTKFQTAEVKEERIKTLLKAVGLKDDILERFPHEFSGGERQRIAIARALVLNPKLLILDEAVSSLDMIVQAQILDLLKDLQSKFHLTYVFITHNLRIVKKISHRIAVMYQGKIVELASTREIFENPLHPYTKQLLSAALTYQLPQRIEEVVLPQCAKLTEVLSGHFVLTAE